MFKIFKVKGDSMQPCYRHGDYVVLLRGFRHFLKAGDDIVCMHPHFGLILKRIDKISASTFTLHGLNQSSTDKAMLGSIQTSTIVGRVFWHIKRPLKTSIKKR